MSDVKSTGGSSSYYDIDLWSMLMHKQVQLKFGDYMRDGLHNEADLCNIAKAAHRIAQLRNGGGKNGTDEIYDLNKIIYFAEERKAYLENSIKIEKT